MMRENKNDGGFNLKALVATMVSLALLLSWLPCAFPFFRAKARLARCIGNLKQVGLALELWHNNSMEMSYPPAALPWFAGENEIGSWPEMLVMSGPFVPEKLHAGKDKFKEHGVALNDFAKYIDNVEVFKCPADVHHPHPMNEARAKAEKFWRANENDGYRYSYGLSAAIGKKKFDKNAAFQVLAADGVWYEIYNFSAAYKDDPKAKYDAGGDHCNRIGYFHGWIGRANVVCRDGSARTVKYGDKGQEIDTDEIFFLKEGEALSEKY